MIGELGPNTGGEKEVGGGNAPRLSAPHHTRRRESSAAGGTLQRVSRQRAEGCHESVPPCDPIT